MTPEELQKLLNVPDFQTIAYGYTFDRHTLTIHFENNKIIRNELIQRGQPDKWEQKEFDHLDGRAIFHADVKRWYRDRTNSTLVELFQAFGSPLQITG